MKAWLDMAEFWAPTLRARRHQLIYKAKDFARDCRRYGITVNLSLVERACAEVGREVLQAEESEGVSAR